jgi:hypothetical protein
MSHKLYKEECYIDTRCVCMYVYVYVCMCVFRIICTVNIYYYPIQI